MHDKSRKTVPLAAQLKEVPAPLAPRATAMHVQFGRPLPPQQQLLVYSADEWEAFIHEWVDGQRKVYPDVRRFSGPGDTGIDIAGFTDDKLLLGVWDNFQCKHYDKPLTPADAAGEIAKILWYTFNKEYATPRKYYFIAPKQCGPTLNKLISNAPKLREHIIKNWDSQCADAVTGTKTIPLEGVFKAYAEAFDFSIFAPRTLLEILTDHRAHTPQLHAVRFGGGLPERPTAATPPYQEVEDGSRYIQQLFEAYSDHTKSNVVDRGCLTTRQDLTDHFNRQREFFYHAEALRNFARDTVPTGTFDELQTEVHAGVADVEGSAHADGLARMNAVTQTASTLRLTSNALISVVKVQDCKGICHQLANEDRLRWSKA